MDHRGQVGLQLLHLEMHLKKGIEICLKIVFQARTCDCRFEQVRVRSATVLSLAVELFELPDPSSPGISSPLLLSLSSYWAPYKMDCNKVFLRANQITCKSLDNFLSVTLMDLLKVAR